MEKEDRQQNTGTDNGPTADKKQEQPRIHKTLPKLAKEKYYSLPAQGLGYRLQSLITFYPGL